MTAKSGRPWICPTAGLLRSIVGAAALLVSIACLSASAAEPGRQTGESVFKGHRLTTYIDDAVRRATVELDDREILAKEGVAEIGKISTVDLVTSFIYYLHVKTTAGCGSYVIVRVLLTADPGKSEVLSDFGACNDKLSTEIEHREGWAAWYAVVFRDDRATAQVALIRDDKLTTQEVKASPCLFVAGAHIDCFEAILSEAAGSGDLGLPTGSGTFADKKVETFLNRSTGKATLQINGRVFRTFDNATAFYLSSVDGADQFGLFAFFLKPRTGCSTRPIVYFAGPTSEPEVILDFAPCTDRMARLTRRKGNAVEWSGIAFHLGEPRGYIASVADHKVSTRSTLVPACMLDADKSKTESCVVEALGGPAPSRPPQLRVIPAPNPRSSPKAPRTLGI